MATPPPTLVIVGGAAPTLAQPKTQAGSVAVCLRVLGRQHLQQRRRCLQAGPGWAGSWPRSTNSSWSASASVAVPSQPWLTRSVAL